MMRGHDKAEQPTMRVTIQAPTNSRLNPGSRRFSNMTPLPMRPQLGEILPSSIDSSEEPAGYVTIA